MGRAVIAAVAATDGHVRAVRDPTRQLPAHQPGGRGGGSLFPAQGRQE